MYIYCIHVYICLYKYFDRTFGCLYCFNFLIFVQIQVEVGKI